MPWDFFSLSPRVRGSAAHLTALATDPPMGVCTKLVKQYTSTSPLGCMYQLGGGGGYPLPLHRRATCQDGQHAPCNPHPVMSHVSCRSTCWHQSSPIGPTAVIPENAVCLSLSLCVCVCVCVCARACVCACTRACVCWGGVVNVGRHPTFSIAGSLPLRHDSTSQQYGIPALTHGNSAPLPPCAEIRLRWWKILHTTILAGMFPAQEART